MGIFQKLNDQGLTIVLVTHEPDIAQFAQRSIQFRDGKIRRDEQVRTGLAHPKSSRPFRRWRTDPVMDFSALFRIAMRALARNKLRSVLTMLGIIVGVGAVIAMLAVGQGAQQTMQQQIQAMGSNMLFVEQVQLPAAACTSVGVRPKAWSYDDMLAILRECPAAHAAAPGSSSNAQVVFGNDNWATRLNGTEPQYFDVRTWGFQEGSSFTQNDVDMSANVAVIGETVRKNLFGASIPSAKPCASTVSPFALSVF